MSVDTQTLIMFLIMLAIYIAFNLPGERNAD
jgi:hypothetical protein